MKKISKYIGVFAIFLLFFITGCVNPKKYNALYEYEESLKLDLIYYEQFEITSKQVFSATSYKEQISYLGIMEANIKQLKDNAEIRNSLIEDPEVKEIDDCYVKALNDIYNSYKIMREGADERDESKMKAGTNNMSNAVDSFSNFIDKYEWYTTKYDINIEDFSGIKEEIEALKNIY